MTYQCENRHKAEKIMKSSETVYPEGVSGNNKGLNEKRSRENIGETAYSPLRAPGWLASTCINLVRWSTVH